jgi:hypothetical protein
MTQELKNPSVQGCLHRYSRLVIVWEEQMFLFIKLLALESIGYSRLPILNEAKATEPDSDGLLALPTASEAPLLQQKNCD